MKSNAKKLVFSILNKQEKKKKTEKREKKLEK